MQKIYYSSVIECENTFSSVQLETCLYIFLGQNEKEVENEYNERLDTSFGLLIFLMEIFLIEDHKHVFLKAG